MNLRQLIDRWSKTNHLVFGRHCRLCGGAVSDVASLCIACRQDLPTLGDAQCPQCALTAMAGQRCGQCLRVSPAFDRTLALFSYAHPVDALLQRYKYQQRLDLGVTFASLWQERLAGHTLPDLIIPMPLHPTRIKERGFNQSLEIARPLARRLQLPLDARACQRIRHTPPQASLPLKSRVKNMRGAFACNRRFDGLRIALIDDVMTTGASLHELAKVIKAAGATEVECWVVARTLPR